MIMTNALCKSPQNSTTELPTEICISTSVLNGAKLDPKIKELRLKLDSSPVFQLGSQQNIVIDGFSIKW